MGLVGSYGYCMCLVGPKSDYSVGVAELWRAPWQSSLLRNLRPPTPTPIPSHLIKVPLLS
jgi:hypothetical protein